MPLRRGFTLVELLAAIFVVAILLALILPRTSGMRERSDLAAMKHSVTLVAALQYQHQDRYGAFAGTVDLVTQFGGSIVGSSWQPAGLAGWVHETTLTNEGVGVHTNALPAGGFIARAWHRRHPDLACRMQMPDYVAPTSVTSRVQCFRRIGETNWWLNPI
jgi:prepilin-type N-terminal cleavage/methylation domain-containing protein